MPLVHDRYRPGRKWDAGQPRARQEEVTVKDADGKEIVLKYNDKTKVSFLDKDGNAKDGTIEAAAKLFSNPKAANKMKIEYTAGTDNLVTEFKLRGRKGK